MHKSLIAKNIPDSALRRTPALLRLVPPAKPISTHHVRLPSASPRLKEKEDEPKQQEVEMEEQKVVEDPPADPIAEPIVAAAAGEL